MRLQHGAVIVCDAAALLVDRVDGDTGSALGRLDEIPDLAREEARRAVRRLAG